LKRILIFIFLSALACSAQLAVPGPIPNDTSTGTTLNKLAKYNTTSSATSVVITATSDVGQAIGMCAAGCGTSGSASIITIGQASCVFDNTTVANDYVQISSGTAGDCHDAGSTRPTSGQIIGTVFGAGGSAGTYKVALNKDIYPSSASTSANLFGDGSDGAVTADGTTTVTCLGAPSGSTYTMTRDCYFTTLTVNSGVTVKTVSNRLLATTSITNSGTISNAGNTGGGGGGASGTNKATGGTAGSNSSVVVAGSLVSPVQAVGGRTGANGGTGVGSNGTNGTIGNSAGFALTSSTGNAGAAGGTGGASGASGGNNSGGTGGTAASGGPSVLAHYSPHEVSVAKNIYDPAANALQPSGGNGGSGSGASGGGDATNSGGGGGGSGGGGGQGGFIVMISPTITLNAGSVINVSGGTGGVGGAGGTPTTGNCGGGGGGAGGDGGNGGILVRIYSTLTNNGTDNVAAGTGGTGGALGTGVGTGTNGTAGTNGNAGNVGLIYNLQLSVLS
jgi:hypothetical protein